MLMTDDDRAASFSAIFRRHYPAVQKSRLAPWPITHGMSATWQI